MSDTTAVPMGPGFRAAGLVCAALLAGAAPAQASLVAWLPMNETAWSGTPPQVSDASGNGHDGTALGGVNTVADATFGYAGNFAGPGSGNYVALGGSGTLSGDRSFVIWANVPVNSFGLSLPLLTGGPGGSGDMFGIAGTTTPEASQYQLYLDFWGCCTSYSYATITPEQWTQIAVTFTPGLIQFYIDGEAVATKNGGNMHDYTFNSITIGGNTIGGTTTENGFLGLLHGARIYDTELTAAEIKAIYAQDLPAPATLALLALGGLALRRVRRA